MKDQSKYLLLQVWCGLLTMSMVVMAVFLSSIKPKAVQDDISTPKPTPKYVSPTGAAHAPNVNTFLGSLKSTGTSPSYIQLIKNANDPSWKESPSCGSCSLVLSNNSIKCTKNSVYFFFAHVTFRNTPQSKSVVLKRNPGEGVRLKILAQGKLQKTMEGSLWVAKIVSLREGDSVSLDISGDVLNDATVWGAYELH